MIENNTIIRYLSCQNVVLSKEELGLLAAKVDGDVEREKKWQN